MTKEKCTFSDTNKNCNCILHCKKDDWYESNEDNSKNWEKSQENIKIFWDKINEKITHNNLDENGKKIAEDIQREYNIELYEHNFESIIFPKSNFEDINYKSFKDLNNLNIKFKNCDFIGQIDFSLLFNAKDISFYNCKFFDNVKFINTTFKNIFLLEGCTFKEDVLFQNITFLKVSAFISSIFHKKLHFVHSKFMDLGLFNDANTNTFIIDNSFFVSEANFLNFKVKHLDRETARIIKHSFEKLDNIIEANKFYALEMKERENDEKLHKYNHFQNLSKILVKSWR